MDKEVPTSTPWLRWTLIGGLSVAIAALTTMVVLRSGDRVQRLESSKLTLSEIYSGRFDDYIPIRANVEPAHTVFLDTVEGGRVEEVQVEDGAAVEKGDIIVVLTNRAVQLDFLAREAEVTEQLNAVRTQELELERNRLQHKRDLVEIEYNVIRLQRSFARRTKLHASGHVSDEELDSVGDELNYWKQRRVVTRESQRSESKLQSAQLKQIRASAVQLRSNLDLARSTLESLVVRAPRSGTLTALEVEPGQLLASGERIGQIDDSQDFKLSAMVDEFYVSRVEVGQRATSSLGADTHEAVITKIYPQIREGRFEIDLEFEGGSPSRVRRGQTIPAQLALGESKTALLVPNGAFYQTTGGHWVFVVNQDRTEARRRSVRLGRRNARYIEVLEGLDEGELVITSAYTSFAEAERLDLGSINP
ncbi:MAG: efflux RND transporter periplasmic adaptor subunit [Myxococcota bacterium]